MSQLYSGSQPTYGAYNPGNAFKIISGYPFRNNGVSPHAGIDWQATAGTPIPAAAKGTVFYVGADYPGSSYGNWVVLKHK